MAGLLALHENVNIAATANANAVPLALGQTYVLVATAACYVKHGPTGQPAVTASTGYILPAFVPYEVPCRNAQEQSISIIRVSEDGSLNIARQN